MNWFIPQFRSRETGVFSNFYQPSSKVVCVGRNYAEHAKELNNPIPESPLLFIKPNTSLCRLDAPIQIDSQKGECHHELEIAILIGETLSSASQEQVVAAISGVGLALDLTLREVQSDLKSKGQPWEKAKAFDGAAPVSGFRPAEDFDLANIDFSMSRNGNIVQIGNSAQMLFPIVPLIATISTHFTLLPGDIVLTGTPAGVGELKKGDQLEFFLNEERVLKTQVESKESKVKG